MKKLTKTWLKNNLKTGPNYYGCGFELRKNGEIIKKTGNYYSKKDIVEKIYRIQNEKDFDEIVLHSPSSDGASDSGNKIKIPN